MSEMIPRNSGESNGSAKLTEWQVKEIKNAVGISGIELARHYKVSRPTISSIRNGRTWRHVK